MAKEGIKVLAGLLVVAGIAVLVGSVYIVSFMRPKTTTQNYVQAAAMAAIVAGLALWAAATKKRNSRR